MGWRRELQRSLDAAAGRTVADPDTWQGQDQDQWWVEMRAKRERERAR